MNCTTSPYTDCLPRRHANQTDSLDFRAVPGTHAPMNPSYADTWGLYHNNPPAKNFSQAQTFLEMVPGIQKREDEKTMAFRAAMKRHAMKTMTSTWYAETAKGRGRVIIQPHLDIYMNPPTSRSTAKKGT